MVHGRMFHMVNKFKCMPPVEEVKIQAPLLSIELLYVSHQDIYFLYYLTADNHGMHISSHFSRFSCHLQHLWNVHSLRVQLLKCICQYSSGYKSMLSTSNEYICGSGYVTWAFLCTHSRERKRLERSRLEFQLIRNILILENQHTMSETIF